MKGDASRVLGVAPRLILALALHQRGETDHARKQLAGAILSHDWTRQNVYDQDGCICHILRREAEQMLLPHLPEFLEGTYQPQNNDERLAMMGVCRFMNRTRSAAQLYADSFVDDPNLAGNFRVGFRYQAACQAAQAGSCRGTDVAQLNDEQRARWRTQAKEWLRADLLSWQKLFDTDQNAARDLRQRLGEWKTKQELACIRDKTDLEYLPEDERKEWQSLWNDVDALLARVPKAN